MGRTARVLGFKVSTILAMEDASLKGPRVVTSARDRRVSTSQRTWPCKDVRVTVIDRTNISFSIRCSLPSGDGRAVTGRHRGAGAADSANAKTLRSFLREVESVDVDAKKVKIPTAISNYDFLNFSQPARDILTSAMSMSGKGWRRDKKKPEDQSTCAAACCWRIWSMPKNPG